MFRGIGRQVIIIKNIDSKIFEEAIFIIKSNNAAPKDDMLDECERIIRSSCTDMPKYNNKRRKKALILAVLGMLTVIAILLPLLCR